MPHSHMAWVVAPLLVYTENVKKVKFNKIYKFNKAKPLVILIYNSDTLFFIISAVRLPFGWKVISAILIR